eukprot:TRINITY_DN10253_c0_g1_i1.p1 TRINITY_DN10253_c0_g1~~TRINITY_DN10253_c0_g1_i1.p1  ORF type:complete len:324 (+),score=66.26 TRINITY_DN10253_c0_g1_i1:357-1328(+)
MAHRNDDDVPDSWESVDLASIRGPPDRASEAPDPYKVILEHLPTAPASRRAASAKMTFLDVSQPGKKFMVLNRPEFTVSLPLDSFIAERSRPVDSPVAASISSQPTIAQGEDYDPDITPIGEPRLILDFTALSSGVLTTSEPDELLQDDLFDKFEREYPQMCDFLFDETVMTHSSSAEAIRDVEARQLQLHNADHVLMAVRYPPVANADALWAAIVAHCERSHQESDSDVCVSDCVLTVCRLIARCSRPLPWKVAMCEELHLLANRPARSASQRSEQLELLDKVLAMVLQRLPRYHVSEKEHFMRLAVLHSRTREQWIQQLHA